MVGKEKYKMKLLGNSKHESFKYRKQIGCSGTTSNLVHFRKDLKQPCIILSVHIVYFLCALVIC